MNHKQKRANSVLIFDFDGVLAQPWTHPELPYKDVKDVLDRVSEKHFICVASFNPRAALAVADWNLFQPFDAVRCGANHIWDTRYREEWRKEMSKEGQIKEILKELGLKEAHTVQFFDDDQKNVDAVNAFNCTWTAFLVNNKKGLGFDDVKHL
jgi:phosphoglycolate phosphatase-like HAD superfamily hydrolase